MSAAHSPMVIAAARALCKRSAVECNVDFEDWWKVYGEECLKDAFVALEACGAPELLAFVEWFLKNRDGPGTKEALDAYAKATGGAA